MVSNARYAIGVSSYSDGTSTSPHGKMQTVIDATLAAQIASAAFEFDRDVLKFNGEHVTPNEGIRELERQQELYDLYKNHGGALAAYPGTSTHGPQIGTAVDWGVTRANGSNRALTSAEFSALYTILARRGIVHTGAHFVPSEAWHVNGGYAQYVAPIPNAPLPGTYTPPKPPVIVPKEDIMQIGQVSDTGKNHNGSIFAFTGNAVHATTNITEVYNLGRVAGIFDPATDTEAEIRAKINDLGLTVSQAQLQSYVQYVQKIGGYIDPTYSDLKAK